MGELGRASNIQGQAFIAAAAVDGGFAGGTGFTDGGCIASVVHVAASGVYAITLNPEQDAFENVVHVSVRNGIAGANAQYAWTTPDQVITVTTFNAAGAATDQAFDITITRARRNPA